MAKAAPKVVEKVLTVGEIAERMEELRQLRKPLAAQDKKLKDEYDELALKALEKLDAEKSTKGGCKRATLSLSEVDVPIVEDVKVLIPYIVKNKLFHLLLANPLTTPAWREAKGLKGSDLPGTKTFTKRGINHASIA